MSVDKEKMLEILDDFKNKLVGLMEEKDRAAEEKVNTLSSELSAAKAVIDDTDSKLKEIEAESASLKTQIEEIESSKGEAVDAVTRERDELRAEMDEINAQLSRVSELYQEVSAEKDKLQEKVDVSDLLAIYITLIESIFGGKPHARVLYTLHNTKTAITRKNIESSTGVMPTAVMKAIHDLRNADLVSFDDESQEVKLIKDIL
ncbi:MAG: hypothetical protein ACXADL_06780 [Candidatus Thorarchaeota archaeon]|jgi:SMC interacting uncharacterized protein involved in chromosome segregation